VRAGFDFATWREPNGNSHVLHLYLIDRVVRETDSDDDGFA
jgi:hypothetical protein